MPRPTRNDLWSRFAGSTLSLFCLLALFGAWSISAQETDPADDAVALFNKGQDAHEKGDFASAIEFYDKALKIVPEFPEAEAQKGAAYLAMGRLEDAEKSYRRAVELRSDWSLAVAGLGDVLVQQRKYSEAEPVLKKAIFLDRMNYPAYTALVELKLRTAASPEQLNALLSSIDSITASARPTAAMWAAKAALQNALGNRADAQKSLASAIKIDPDNRAALSQSIDLAVAENDATGARGFLTKLEAVTKDRRSTDLYRAKVLLIENKLSEAEKILTGLGGAEPEAERLLASIRLNSNNDPDSLVKQLASEPKNAAILGRLCNVNRTTDPTAAVDYCRRALEAEPDNLGFATGYGAALLQAKKYAEAVELLSKLKAAAPDNATVRANLATALFQLKRFQGAKVEYQWLTEKQPKLAAAYYFLAIVHDQLGEYMDAMANYQLFLRVADPEANKLEIEKVNLRLPGLQKQIKERRGKKND